MNLKVWAGNDDCKKIVVEECKLVNVTRQFNQTETECIATGSSIPWTDCEYINKTQSTSVMTCSPKSALECEPVSKTLCTTG